MTGLQTRRGAKVLGLLVLLGLMTGCWGIWLSSDYGPSTQKARVDFELIANSQLAIDDTTPDWQLGRYGFKPGADELLVMTRITSWAPRDDDGKEVGPRVDHQYERAWITIPFGTEIGQEIKAEILEPQFLVGYDSSEDNLKFFIQPSSMRGTVRVLERHPTNELIAIHIVVEPGDDHGKWEVEKTVSVPITTAGIHARAASPNAIIPKHTPAMEAATQPETQPATQPATAPATQPVK